MALYWICLHLLMGRLCKKSSNTLYYVSWSGVWHRFVSIFSWAGLRCAQVEICHKEQLTGIRQICLRAGLNALQSTLTPITGMSECILYLTLFLSSISFHWVTATSKQNKANFLLHTKHLFQTQTYSGQTHRKMHTVICLEKSRGLSESVNIW